jgi:hypothetical protein
MAALQGAVETSAPVSRLHQQQSYDPADFPVPTGREEQWRFTPLRSFSEGGPHPASGGWARRHPARRLTLCMCF